MSEQKIAELQAQLDAANLALAGAEKELEDIYSNKDYELFSNEELQFGVNMALMEPMTLLEPFAKLWDVIDKDAYYRQMATLAFDKETGAVTTKCDSAFWLSSKPFERARKYLAKRADITAKAPDLTRIAACVKAAVDYREAVLSSTSDVDRTQLLKAAKALTPEDHAWVDRQ